MSTFEAHSVAEVELDDGSKALVIGLSSSPLDCLAIFAPDVSEDSKRLLGELGASWESLWPKIKNELEKEIREYETDQVLEPDACIGSVTRIQSGEYKSDISDIHLRLDFGDAPLWDSFIRGTNLAHFQAVF